MRLDAERRKLEAYAHKLEDTRVAGDAFCAALMTDVLQDMDARIAALQAKRERLVADVRALRAERIKAADTTRVTLAQVRAFQNGLATLPAPLLRALPSEFIVLDTPHLTRFDIAIPARTDPEWVLDPHSLDPSKTSLLCTVSNRGQRIVSVLPRDELGAPLSMDYIKFIAARHGEFRLRGTLSIPANLIDDTFEVRVTPQRGLPFVLTIRVPNYYEEDTQVSL